MLTKKNYIAIAARIRTAMDRASMGTHEELAVADVVTELCDYFKSDNPAFNRDRFLTACGIDAAL